MNLDAIPKDRIRHSLDFIQESKAKGLNHAESMKKGVRGHGPKLAEKVGALNSSYAATDAYKGDRVVVVGGGLSTAHLALKALKHGAEHCTLVLRDCRKSKQYDLDLEWMGSGSRISKLQEFLTEPDLNLRAGMLKKARGGGSMTPESIMAMDAHVEAGNLTLMEQTEVWDAVWTTGASGTGEGHFRVDLSDNTMVTCDRLWCCTGSTINIKTDPFWGKLMEKHPIDVASNGMPMITTDLQWKKGVNLWMLGPYAALQLGNAALNFPTLTLTPTPYMYPNPQLGPDALNLSGGRNGATRIVAALREDQGILPDKKRGISPNPNPNSKTLIGYKKAS